MHVFTPRVYLCFKVDPTFSNCSRILKWTLFRGYIPAFFCVLYAREQPFPLVIEIFILGQVRDNPRRNETIRTEDHI